MRQRSSRAKQPRGSRGRGSPPPAAGALDAGLRLLGRRAHSRAELRGKLVGRGYSESDVDAAVFRLADLGYINDPEFAEAYVRRRSPTRGPLALLAELATRGVDRRVAGLAVARFGTDAQLVAATRLAERLCGKRTWAGYHEMLNSVGPRLVRRGFSPALVQAACRAAWAGTQASLEA